MATEMEKIEGLTNKYAEYRLVLANDVGALKADIAAAKSKWIRAIRNSARLANGVKGALEVYLYENPELFKRPKTRVFSGIRVGWMKRKGRVIIDNERATIDRIRKLLPPNRRSC